MAGKEDIREINNKLRLIKEEIKKSSQGNRTEHDETQVKLDDVVYSLEKNGLSDQDLLTAPKTYAANTYKKISFLVRKGDADISLNGSVINYKENDNAAGFELENQSSTGVTDTVTVTPSANSEVVVIYKSL